MSRAKSCEQAKTAKRYLAGFHVLAQMAWGGPAPSAVRIETEKTVFEVNSTARSSILNPRSSTVLAFDFGLKRIGVATGDSELGIAHPLETIPYAQRFERIAALVKEWQPALLVVGLPISEDGNEREITRGCREFARALTARFGIAVELVDENFTSSEAAAALKQAGIAGIRQKPFLDQVAAQHILQSFFDAASRR